MLSDFGRLDLIMPKNSWEASKLELEKYRQRFSQQYPDFEMFRTVPREQWQFCIPIKLHGDEGRSMLVAFYVLAKILLPNC